jgi:hypothetical protein
LQCEKAVEEQKAKAASRKADHEKAVKANEKRSKKSTVQCKKGKKKV